MEVDMSNDLRWGGIGVKSLLKAVLSDIWTVFAVVVIAWLGIGIVGNMRYTPSYTSSTVVAVYPFNKISTPEASSDSLETVGAVSQVFNSGMFTTGLRERLTEPVDFYLYSQQIEGTYLLKLSVSAGDPADAYRTLRTALSYYEEISAHLVGDSQLEILTEPEFPTVASGESKILKNRTLLSLFAGFAMGCFLILMYVIRKTYKSSSAIQGWYKDVQFFWVRKPDSMRKTALELMQMLRAKDHRSVFVTSALPGEGKSKITAALAKELEDYGKSVIIMETDTVETGNDFSDTVKDVEKKLEEAKELADIVIVDGCAWAGSGDVRIWKEAADTTLAVCRQDKADFDAIDRMMADLQGNGPEFLGCVLNGF